MKAAATTMRLLGDETRLRLLRLLARERLNVSELTSILGVAQSGVSRHLGMLKDAGLVEEAREGGFTWYRARSGENGNLGDLWRFLGASFEDLDALSRGDDARLTEVLRVRKEAFARHGVNGSQLVPGRSWAAWARALGHLLPPIVVGDLGCGEGYLTVETARWASRVIAVDHSAAVLREAKSLAKRRGVDNIVWRRGDLEALPLDDRSVDLSLLSQALHHAEHPDRALAEAVRVTRPGGRVLILDLRTHDQPWVRERLGDRWLGFSDSEMTALLVGAGLEDVKTSIGATLRGDPFTVLIASGTCPPAHAA